MPQTLQRRHIKGAFVGIMGIALAASLTLPSLAFAEPSIVEKQAEAQSTLATLNTMQEKLDTAAAHYDEALLAQKEAEANSIAAQERIEEANVQIADLQERLGHRARSMYRVGNSTMLDLLLGSTTFQSFATGWDILNKINESDVDLVDQTKDLRAEVQEQEAVYAEQARVAKDKAEEAKRMQDETTATFSSMQATYDGLSAEVATLLEEERAAQQAAAAATAQDVVDSSIQQATDNSNSGGGSADAPAPAPSPSPSPEPAPEPTPPPSGPTYNPSTGNAVVDRAYGQIGRAYGYGDPSYGAGPNEYDCSGFVSYALSGSHSRMGSTYTFMAWPQVSDPQPGDVAVNSGHCGIYIGGGQMIHSATYGVGVVVGPVQGGMTIVRPPW